MKPTRCIAHGAGPRKTDASFAHVARKGRSPVGDATRRFYGMLLCPL